MHRRLQIAILLFIVADMASAGAWNDRRSQLENVASVEHFRIFYSLSGKDALPKSRRADLDGNGVPDFIDQIAKRLLKADRFYSGAIGLTPPLQSRRYAGIAHFIDVNVLDFSHNKKGPKKGIAYDGTPRFYRAFLHQASLSVLAIDIAGAVRLKTNTVEHELFHLYQNGYTYFKNRWYTEGTARWAEKIIYGRIGAGGPLPSSTEDKIRLFNQSYDASSFWNELIIRSDESKRGKDFIKLLLERLGELDDLAARQRGIKNSNWKESEQRSKENDRFIWRAAIETTKRLGSSSSLNEEMSQLLHL